MCADSFCGWNLFGHQVFLPAIAIMSSQQIRILQSSNLYWCRNSHIHEGILVCPARHPLLHAAIDKVMETRPSSLRSRQPEYMTFYRQMWKLLQSRSENKLQNWSKCTWQLEVGVLTTRAKTKTSLPTNMQWINSEGWIFGLCETLEQASCCQWMWRLEAWF